MRSHSAWIAGFLLLSSARAANADTLPFEVKTERLKNGLNVVMVPIEDSGLIAYYTLVRVGSRDEAEKGVTGFAHFFEHMMFRGTEKNPPDKVQEFLLKSGADQNGFTTDDFTCYTFFGSSKYLKELVEIEADRFQNLVYTEDVFKTESKAVLGEYNKSASNPELILEEKLREQVFKNHTYGHTTLGYLADIEAMPTQYKYSLEFFKRFYTPDNSTIIAVGDFDPAELMTLIRQNYGTWNRKGVPPKIKAEPKQEKEIRLDVPWNSPTLPIMSFSWRTPPADYKAKDTAVYNVLGELLFGKISPLYRDLVLEKQMVVGLNYENWSWNHRDPYLFHVVATLKKTEDFGKLEAAIDEKIAGLIKDGIDDAYLRDVKAHVRYGVLLGMSTPSNIASYLAFSIGPTGDADGLQKLLLGIEAVTSKDVQSFAKRYLVKNNRSIVTLEHKETQK